MDDLITLRLETAVSLTFNSKKHRSPGPFLIFFSQKRRVSSWVGFFFWKKLFYQYKNRSKVQVAPEAETGPGEAGEEWTLSGRGFVCSHRCLGEFIDNGR